MIIFRKAHPATQAMSSAAKPADLNEGDIRRNPGEPDAKQAEASTYNKPRIEWQGLTIAIENPAGSVRRGRNRHGVTWEVRMRFDYGEILGSLGVDGDPVDVIVGPNLDAPMVYVVHQRKVNDWANYDEDKCCVGFESQSDAEQAFLSNYNDPRFLGPITAMPVEEFVAKVRATKDKPAMIKSAAPVVLFFKARVGAYLRGGKLVNLAGYQGRTAKPRAHDGQLSLFAPPSVVMGPNRYKDKHPVHDTPDLFEPQHTEPTRELIEEHEHLVDVLNSPSHEDDKVEAKKQAAELEEYKQEAGAVQPGADIPTNSIIRDAKGKQYRVHYMRWDLIVSHPIVDGKAQVSADTTVRFRLSDDIDPTSTERPGPVYVEKLTDGYQMDGAKAVRAEEPAPVQPVAEQDVAKQPTKAQQTRARRKAVLDVLGDGWKADAGVDGAKDRYTKVFPKEGGGKLEVTIMPEKTVSGNFYVGSYHRGGKRTGVGSNDSTAQTIEEAKAIAERFAGVSKPEPKHTTDTPEFKRWFGSSKVVDADGKPLRMYHGSYKDFAGFDRRASVGFRRGMETMDTVGSWFSSNPGEGGAAIYASGPGAAIYPVYLAISNPKHYDTFDDFLNDMHTAAGRDPSQQSPKGVGTTDELRNKLKAEGYDGIKFGRTNNMHLHDEADRLREKVKAAQFGKERDKAKAEYEAHIKKIRGMGEVSTEFDRQDVWVAFEPTQIKSATGNSGAFDPDHPDITKAQVAPILFVRRP